MVEAKSLSTPGYPIDSKDQAKAWVMELVDLAQQSRLQCNVIVPGDDGATVRQQRKAHRQFLTRYGQAEGALMALHRTRLLDDLLYREMHARCLATLVPTVVGSV